MRNTDLNEYQRHYVKEFCGGRRPRSATRKRDMELLGKVKDKVIIHFPDHNETYRVTLNDCDIPNGIISVEALLWAQSFPIDF
jgi:hypothetical protein